MGGCCTEIDELFVASHFGASLARANAKKLYDEQVKFENKLTDMLINPNTLVDFSRKFTNFLNVCWLVPDKLLQVFLHTKGAIHT